MSSTSSTLVRRHSARLARQASTGPYASTGSTGLTSYMATSSLDWEEKPPSGSTISRTLSKFASRAKGASSKKKSEGKTSNTRATRAPPPPSVNVLTLSVKRNPRVALGINVASSKVAATITSVVPGSSGDEAGLKVGDVVYAVDGNELTSKLGDLLSSEKYKKVTSFKLTVSRGVVQAELAVPYDEGQRIALNDPRAAELTASI